MREKKILIIRTDGIGDFVIFSAVLEEYAKLYEGYQIDLLCRPILKDLVVPIPFINKIICINKIDLFRKKYFLQTLFTLIRVKFFKYDKIIFPVYSRTLNDDELIQHIKGDEKIAFDGDDSNDHDNSQLSRNKYFTKIINSKKEQIPEIERNLELINALGSPVTIDAIKPKIWYSDKDEADFQRLKTQYQLSNNKYITLVPGAYDPIRYWTNKNWTELIERTVNKYPDYPIVVLGHGDDIIPIKCILESLDVRCKERVVNLYGRTPLRILAKVIQNARLFIGIDTGMTHIAAAVNTRNVCIMGGGHFGRFYPYGDLEKNRIVYKKMNCYGCNWKCKYDEVRCLSEIEVKNVFNKINQILQSL